MDTKSKDFMPDYEVFLISSLNITKLLQTFWDGNCFNFWSSDVRRQLRLECLLIFLFLFYLELLYLSFVTYVDIWVTFRVSCFSFSNKIRFIWTNLSFFFSVIMVDSCKAEGGLESHFLHWEFSLRHLIQFIFFVRQTKSWKMGVLWSEKSFYYSYICFNSCEVLFLP